MGVWDTYAARLNAPFDKRGNAERDSALSHIQDRMRRKITASLSYSTAVINGKEHKVAVIDMNEIDQKKIFSMPGEDLPHGATVDWSGSKWLITQVDAHHEFCTEGRLLRCNHLLRWIDGDGNVVARWANIADGTKYLIGEKAQEMMAIGDARIVMTIGKDRDTEKIHRGDRFLIDDPDSDEVLAYEITKPNRLFNVYNGRGVYRYILNEVNLTDEDNTELRLANYYNWKPKAKKPKPDKPVVGETVEQIVQEVLEKREKIAETIEERRVWL